MNTNRPPGHSLASLVRARPRPMGKLRPTRLDDIVTIDDAVATGRRTGLTGWDLVTYSQLIVCRKFAIYTTRCLWIRRPGHLSTAWATAPSITWR